MPLTRNTYDVWLNLPDRELTRDTPPDHTVTTTTGDQMRAELEAKKLKYPPMREAPINHTALWIWSALARQGLTELPAVAFMADPPEFEPDEETKAAMRGDVDAAQVDPTEADTGGPA